MKKNMKVSKMSKNKHLNEAFFVLRHIGRREGLVFDPFFDIFRKNTKSNLPFRNIIWIMIQDKRNVLRRKGKEGSEV